MSGSNISSLRERLYQVAVVMAKLTPIIEIHRFWFSNTSLGPLFWEHARCTNNSVCLTSIKFKQHNFEKGINPTVIFMGKVLKLSVPLQAGEREDPALHSFMSKILCSLPYIARMSRMPFISVTRSSKIPKK